MKTSRLVFLGILLSLLSIWFIAKHNEGGDANVAMMYIFIYGIVAIIGGIINAYYLRFVEQEWSSTLIIIIGAMTPILVLLWLSNNDNLGFLAEFEAVGLGLTNLIWIGIKISDGLKQMYKH